MLWQKKEKESKEGGDFVKGRKGSNYSKLLRTISVKYMKHFIFMLIKSKCI